MLWRADQHEALVEREWDGGEARRAIEAIVDDAEAAIVGRDGFWPGHRLDDVEEDEQLCSLYLGSAGMIWGLSKLGSSLDAAAAVAAAIERYRAAPDFGADGHPPSLLVGETGLLVVADTVGPPAADRGRLERLIRENRTHSSWELMWGSPGTTLAARACGLEDAWRDSAGRLWAAADGPSGLWTQELYGQVVQYLGPVHGFAGNVHALRGYVDEATLSRRVTSVLTRTALRDGALINWAPLASPAREPASKPRVQWCHGAPGIVVTIGDLMPRDLAIGAGELIWRAGPLRKGAGLCHGTAGNGFALLRLYELSRDPRWLERARRFAVHAVDQVARQRARYGHGRYTLFTGDIGVALYVQACLDEDASFPVLDGF